MFSDRRKGGGGGGSSSITPGTSPTITGGTAKGVAYQDGSALNIATDLRWDKALGQVSIGGVPVDFGALLAGLFAAYQVQGSSNGHRGYAAYNGSAAAAAKSGYYAFNNLSQVLELFVAGGGVSNVFLVAEGQTGVGKTIEVPLQLGTEAASATTAHVYIGCRSGGAVKAQLKVLADGTGFEFSRGLAVTPRAIANTATAVVKGEGRIHLSGLATSSKAITLPLAADVPDGTEILFLDVDGTAGTGGLQWDITRAGSDTINAAATTLALATAYQRASLVKISSTKWSGKLI
jgi:hypothetical protein